ncbi:MAG TPA: gamma carbonic anhydrase family protein [Pseudorhodoplanes sp.]|nr:gamma carbonic anhydrase family protein [Pseudorhodoplanes sp.]
MSPLILPYAGIIPSFATPPAHAGEGSAILGRVTLGRHASIGARTVLRADGHDVKAGDDFFAGARTTLHIAHEVFPCIVGDRVTVGDDCCVHACMLGSNIIVGDRTVILDGAIVGDNVIFEPGSTVFPGKRIDSGHVYAGSPAKMVRPVEAGEVAKRRDAMLAMHKDKTSAIGGSAIAASSQVDPSVFIASTARVRGIVNAAAGSSIWFSNDFNAGFAAISLGLRTNVQDNTVIRATSTGVTIGAGTTVGHNVTMEDCVVGEHCLIGIGSFVAQGTVVEDHVLLAASARTEPGQVLESGWLYAGTPAKKLAPLDTGKREMIPIIIAHYCQYAADYKAAEQALRKTGS